MRHRNYVPQLPNDGYTLDGFVEAKQGFGESVKFKYRPVTAEKQAMMTASLSLLQDTPTNPANFRKRAEIIKGRIISWDIKDDKGNPLLVNQTTIQNLAPELFWKLFGIVFGSIPTDINPEWEEEQQREENELAAKAREEGESVCVAREERDLKN